jgi:alkylation response protein AidB-like acyl-CoA dehydrogenase
MAIAWADVAAGVEELASKWRAERGERQARRGLDGADFRALADIGFLLVSVPEEDGGLWRSAGESTRPIADALRVLGRADPSVALVASMHPAVMVFWMAAPPYDGRAWLEQRAAIAATAVEGGQWGTITSEPGSGGDIARTKSIATPDPAASSAPLPGAAYRIDGDKHFGSGSGVTSYMITTAVPADGEGPALFVLDVRDRPWDGTAGLRLAAEWDGMGMAATQSHAMRLESCPAVRMAWPGPLDEITGAAAPVIPALFTAVVLGVLDEIIETARAQLQPRAESLRAYEQVEWSRAELEHWLAVQAFEGAVRAVEAGDHPRAAYSALRAKEAVAELAERAAGRVAKVLGGGSFSRRSPFASWFEDVRALGFLRPPWGLAYDALFRTSFPPPD